MPSGQLKLTLSESNISMRERMEVYFRGSCNLGSASFFKLIKGSLCLLSSEAEDGADLKLIMFVVWVFFGHITPSPKRMSILAARANFAERPEKFRALKPPRTLGAFGKGVGNCARKYPCSAWSICCSLCCIVNQSLLLGVKRNSLTGVLQHPSTLMFLQA